jgi:DNA-binding transcriptional MerR regulator
VHVHVRALRIYERLGLISPRRTDKNWRLYSASDLARLNEILTLKRLGLSLARITELLAGQETDLEQTLRMQQSALIALRDRVDRSLALVSAIRERQSQGKAASIEELIALLKETEMSDVSLEAVAWRRYEQARPRTEAPVDPAGYPDYTGVYQFETGDFLTVTIRHNKLVARVMGQPSLEIYPEAEDRFFYKAVRAQISFIRNDNGEVTELMLHQGGHELVAKRSSESAAKQAEEALEQRRQSNDPLPGGESLLKRVIEQLRRGEPDYDGMSIPLAMAVREQLPFSQPELTRLGPIETVTFMGVMKPGFDIYNVRFAHGMMEWGLSLGNDGKLKGLYFRPIVGG